MKKFLIAALSILSFSLLATPVFAQDDSQLNQQLLQLLEQSTPSATSAQTPVPTLNATSSSESTEQLNKRIDDLEQRLSLQEKKQTDLENQLNALSFWLKSIFFFLK